MSLEDLVKPAASTAPAAWTVIAEDPVLAQQGHAPVAGQLGGRLGLWSGQGVAVSDDGGLTWRGLAQPWMDIAYAAGAVHAGRAWLLGGYVRGAHGPGRSLVYSSPDLANWTPGPAAPWAMRSRHAAVAFAGRLVVMGGILEGANPRELATDVWASADGATWTQLTGAFPARAEAAVAVLDGQILVVGGAAADRRPCAETLASRDGATWTAAPAPWTPRAGARAVTLGDTLYLIGGRDSAGATLTDVWTTRDGVAWTRLDTPCPSLTEFAACTAAGRLLMLGGVAPAGANPQVCAFNPYPAGWTRLGESDDVDRLGAPAVLPLGGAAFALNASAQASVARSDDLVTWTGLGTPFSYRPGAAACLHEGALVVSGGRRTARLDYQEVLTSTDGFTWTSTQAGWRQRAFHAMASHLGDLFVMGGEVQDLGLGGDVYVYNPQYGWGQERAGAVPPFAEASAISYQNHLWLIGGRTVAGPVNTVYMRASNGDWLPRAAAPWAPRRRPAVFTFGDALFVGLGLDGAGQPLDDMWLTEDGQTWRPADGPVRPAGLRSQPAWGPFGDGLLVLGGSTLPPPSPSPVYLYRPFAG